MDKMIAYYNGLADTEKGIFAQFDIWWDKLLWMDKLGWGIVILILLLIIFKPTKGD